MKKFITDKGFYASLIAIALPIALQNLISFGVSVTDTIMVGMMGEIQLSACSQANQPQFIFALLIFGLASGGTVLASQYWGKGNVEAIRHVIGIILRTAITASILFSALVLIFPRQIMNLYLKDTVVIDEAVKYLQIVGWGYFFFGITSSFTIIIRSMEIVKVSLAASCASFVANVVLDYALIFGKFGAPQMGIRGAALATLIARIVEFSIVAFFAFFIDKKLMFRIKYIFIRDKNLFKDYVKYSLPVLCNEFAWGLGISIQAAILGNLSSEIVSANSISGVLNQLATIGIFGVANATCVVVGKKIGEGDMDGARNASFTLMIWSIILGIGAGIFIFLLRKPFAGIYNLSDETRILAENLLIITSVVVFFASVSSTSIVGVLRGAGDTKFALRLELISLWLVAIPLGAVSAFVLHFHPLWVCAFLKIDEPIKSVIATIRTLKPETYKNVTR